MITKKEIIELLKAEFPILRVGDDDLGYTELSAKDYEATILDWAEVRYNKEIEKTELAAKATAKADLLAKLGITAEEALLLLS
jgi:hypothetical protein